MIGLLIQGSNHKRQKIRSSKIHHSTNESSCCNFKQLEVANSSKIMIMPHSISDQVELNNVFHVSQMKENSVSVSQLIFIRNFVMFGPNGIKV